MKDGKKYHRRERTEKEDGVWIKFGRWGGVWKRSQTCKGLELALAVCAISLSCGQQDGKRLLQDSLSLCT
jgi:hypothetical protein